MKPLQHILSKEGTIYFRIGKLAFHFLIEPKWNGMLVCVTFTNELRMFIVQVGKLIMGVYW